MSLITARNIPCCSSCAAVISGPVEAIWLVAWTGQITEPELTVAGCCCASVLACVDGDEYTAPGEWLTAAAAVSDGRRGPQAYICASPGQIGRATAIHSQHH